MSDGSLQRTELDDSGVSRESSSGNNMQARSFLQLNLCHRRDRLSFYSELQSFEGNNELELRWKSALETETVLQLVISISNSLCPTLLSHVHKNIICETTSWVTTRSHEIVDADIGARMYVSIVAGKSA